jgi:hypothetical protein
MPCLLPVQCRAFWYHFMAAFADKTAQIKGAVVINPFFGAGLTRNSVLHVTELSARVGGLISSVLPGRLASFHFCSDDPRVNLLVSTTRMAFGKSTRLRLRAHIGKWLLFAGSFFIHRSLGRTNGGLRQLLGSDVENEYSLMTFGIRCEGLIQGARKGNTMLHQEYMQGRREEDRSNDDKYLQECTRSGFVPSPSQSDVLFGRGRPYRDFPGNRPWNQLIDNLLDRHRQCSTRFEKTCVTMDVVKMIRDSSVRFLLEPTPGGWKVLDEVAVRAKAAAAFHNRAKTLSRMESREPPVGNAEKRMRYEPILVEQDDPFKPFPIEYAVGEDRIEISLNQSGTLRRMTKRVSPSHSQSSTPSGRTVSRFP